MKNMMKRLRNERGLTLVELLAVIVILAIIATIAFVMIGNVMENAKKDAQIANGQQLIASAKLYEANGGEIGNEGVTAETLHEEGLIEQITDPWEKTALNDNAMSNSKVTKEEKEYSVTLKGSKSITATEEELNQGRDEITFEE